MYVYTTVAFGPTIPCCIDNYNTIDSTVCAGGGVIPPPPPLLSLILCLPFSLIICSRPLGGKLTVELPLRVHCTGTTVTGTCYIFYYSNKGYYVPRSIVPGICLRSLGMARYMKERGLLLAEGGAL